MALIRATVKLGRKSGIAADEVVNVLHFATTLPVGTRPGVIDDIKDAVAGFYNVIGAQLGKSISRTALAHTIEFRTIAEGGPGAGDDTESVMIDAIPFTISTAAFGSTVDLPGEVCSALSFVGFGASAVPEESGSTRPRARHRGRMFIGPLTDNCCVQDADTGRVSMSLIIAESIVDAYATYINSISELSSTSHVVYSPSNGFSYAVVQAWMDDGFDIIRSRGEAAIARFTSPVLI
jgi:hypothetical protein